MEEMRNLYEKMESMVDEKYHEDFRKYIAGCVNYASENAKAPFLKELLKEDYYKDIKTPKFYFAFDTGNRKKDSERKFEFISALNEFLVTAASCDGDFSMDEVIKVGNIITELKLSVAKAHIESFNDADMIFGMTFSDKGSAVSKEIEKEELSCEKENTEDREVSCEKSEEKLKEALDELNGLVGLENIKEDVKGLLNFIKVTNLRKEKGLKAPSISYHLVFTGNPGTGKTTVARLIAKLYYQMGILPEDKLVEVDRSGLVGGYLGQTAIKTKEVINKATGGVLFIDEAYSLANDKTEDAYGREAIETVLKAMEDHRDELVVIVAGYTELMHKFIDSNPGLKSRFNKYFEFNDYTGEELADIFKSLCKSNGYEVDEDTQNYLLEKFKVLYENRKEDFGNGRTVRNIFEKSINAQANRVSEIENPGIEELMKIEKEDIPED